MLLTETTPYIYFEIPGDLSARGAHEVGPTKMKALRFEQQHGQSWSHLTQKVDRSSGFFMPTSYLQLVVIFVPAVNHRANFPRPLCRMEAVRQFLRALMQLRASEVQLLQGGYRLTSVARWKSTELIVVAVKIVEITIVIPESWFLERLEAVTGCLQSSRLRG